MSGRNYTNVFVAGPADDPDTGCDALAGTVFKSVTTNNIAASGTPLRCNDQWSFVATFAALRACGFVVSSANNLTTGFQTWDGTIRVVCCDGPRSFLYSVSVFRIVRKLHALLHICFLQ
jgi:hypothetical protein